MSVPAGEPSKRVENPETMERGSCWGKERVQVPWELKSFISLKWRMLTSKPQKYKISSGKMRMQAGNNETKNVSCSLVYHPFWVLMEERWYHRKPLKIETLKIHHTIYFIIYIWNGLREGGNLIMVFANLLFWYIKLLFQVHLWDLCCRVEIDLHKEEM